MRLILRLALLLLVAAVLSVGGFFLVGPERIWARFGEADQGAVDFATLARRPVPNDSLACSPGLCRPPADFALPVYPATPDAVMRALDDAVLADRNVSRVDDRTRPDYRRYVARTPLMRYPDTVDALARPRDGGSGVALYSRSLFGSGDMGVNRARIEGWAASLGSRITGPAGGTPRIVS